MRASKRLRSSIADSAGSLRPAVPTVDVAETGALVTPVEPPADAAVDRCGRFIDSRYRLWHARKEFGLSYCPDIDSAFIWGVYAKLFTELSTEHKLNELLEYATRNPAAPGPLKSETGSFIEGRFFSFFGLQGAQFDPCGLYVR